jgi:enamine deaminase RidA (YjgF/YER057c/UK114 family)
MNNPLCILLSCLLLVTLTGFAQQVQHINPPNLAVSKGYTQVVVSQGGRTAYISGQVSANSKGEVMYKGDFREQTRQVFENLKTALAAVGATFANVVKMTTYVVETDAKKIGIVREVRNQYFTSPAPPASTYIGVQGLYDKDVMLEIEAIAVIK